ncbi:MAG: hypothetical protein SF053_18060 [Bacteroidia bacterium]|nr:hypothetical protein [Bacteroidia bacterium]
MRSFTLLMFTLVLLSGCTGMKELQSHRQALKELATSSLAPEAKFDALAIIVADVLDEAAARPKPYQAFRHLDKFGRQNESSLQALSQELQTWLNEMGPVEKLSLAARTLSKPYSRKLIQTVPKITRMAQEEGYTLGPLEQALVLYRLRGILD